MMPAQTLRRGVCGALILAALAGCQNMPEVRVQLGAGNVTPAPFPGVVIADEPEAARAARAILEAGGSAGDAAVALAFSLAVTLPSAAGLGGGGSCLIQDRQNDLVNFTATSQSSGAAVPALPRGLLALHAKYGDLPWAQVVAPAEALARFGTKVAPPLARALATDGAVLAKDGAALQAFMGPQRQMLQEGETATHAALAATLGRIRTRVTEFYDGPLATEIVAGAGQAGLTAEALRDYLPRWPKEEARNEGLVRRFTPAETSGSRPPDAATTSFLVADGDGYAVACTLTMGQPFGTGVMVKDQGFLLAPAASVPPTLPGEVGATRPRGVLVFIVAGGTLGNAFAPGRTGEQIVDLVPKDARGHMLACPRVEDSAAPRCAVRPDPRTVGYAEVFELKKPSN